MFFDPLYFLFLLPGILLAGWAQIKVRSAYAQGMKTATRRGLSGAEAADRILRANELYDVRIERARGFLGDHYDPRHRVLRLSPEVYDGRSIASVGIAAHEAGHAIQHGVGYAPLTLRNAIVPMASIGTNFAWVLLIIGMMLASMKLMVAGIICFSLVVLFQVINLPVEFNASSRARQVLLANGIIVEQEDPAVAKVLNAAAMTYVAATITAILELLYFLMRAGLLGGNRND